MITFTDEQWFELCDILGMPAVEPSVEPAEAALQRLRLMRDARTAARIREGVERLRDDIVRLEHLVRVARRGSL